MFLIHLQYFGVSWTFLWTIWKAVTLFHCYSFFKGSNKNDSLHVRSQDEKKRTSKWYQETFADSEMINRIYGLSPKRQGSTKHRSAEDLSKITSTNGSNNVKITEPAKTMHRGKSCDGAIDVDAKLVGVMNLIFIDFFMFLPQMASNIKEVVKNY